MRSIFFPHAAAAVLATCIILLVYAAMQQQYRTAANDPQLQIARDAVTALNKGKAATAVIPADTVDMEQSLATCVQVYNASGKQVASNGYINAKPPVAPAGILAKARAEGEYPVSWQPSPAARMSAVVAYTGGEQGCYVLVARSLAESDKRVGALVKMIFICWVLCMCVICAHGLLQAYLSRNEYN